jgi:hypothetical protein
MSIIQEALKKAQGTYTKTVSPPQADIAVKETVDDKIAAPIPHQPVSAKPVLIPVVVVLTIVIGFGLKLFLTDTSNVKAKEPDRPHQVVTLQPVAESIKNSIPTAFISGQAPNLILNGIMYIQERPRAIINGNMVEEGDSVSGARVTAISKDDVTLDYNSTQINLKLLR